MSNPHSPPPPPGGPGSPRDVPPAPGSLPIDPSTLPGPIRDELQAPDPVAIDTGAAELKDGANRCPKCGATEIRHKPGSDLLICMFCRNQWHGQRVEEEFGLGEGLDELSGSIVASGAADIAADAAHLVSFKCSGCGGEVTVNTENEMTARCHWCRHVFGVNQTRVFGNLIFPFYYPVTNTQAADRFGAFTYLCPANSTLTIINIQ